MCEYCTEEIRKDIANTRTEKNYMTGKIPGFEVSIDYDDTLYIGHCADVYEPSWEETSVKINFCPMCGRDLRVKEDRYFMYLAYIDERLEQINKLEMLTGLTLDKLVELFSAGYTLQPPKKSESLEELDKPNRILNVINRWNKNKYATTVGTFMKLHKLGCSFNEISELLDLTTQQTKKYLEIIKNVEESEE